MKFFGVKKLVAVDADYKQIDELTQFWQEMNAMYPGEQLLGLEANWIDQVSFEYYIGKIDEKWADDLEEIEIPDDGWVEYTSLLDDEAIKAMYKEIYKRGRLDYEIESMDGNEFKAKVHFLAKEQS